MCLFPLYNNNRDLKFSEQGQRRVFEPKARLLVQKHTRPRTLRKMELDPVIWSQLPDEIVNKICNMIAKIRVRNNAFLEEIRFQGRRYSRWYYNTMSLFGMDNVYYVMYDDMRNVLQVEDAFPEDMPFETVVEEMWRGLRHEQRDEIIVCS